MFIDFLLESFLRHAQEEALVWRSQIVSYGALTELVAACRRELDRKRVPPGAVVSLEADFSPRAIAFMLALLERRCILVPLTASVEAKKPEFRAIAEVERIVALDESDDVRFSATGRTATHPFLKKLKSLGHPGLILFSSGSSGKNKAAVHDMVPLLAKFRLPRKAKRMISFLFFDHMGGINTLFYALSSGGCIVTIADRNPETVALAIEEFRVQILPISPTFMNLLLLSGALLKHDVASLEAVSYGTEPMPESTLRRFHEQFPKIAIQQLYGLSELGILRSRSRSSDSLWMKIGGEGFQTRVVHGLLEIKAHSAMLGYLNAPSPFTKDGWFKTGDRVEMDGEYLRILGRDSEMINVGGQKVFPAEVESVLQTMNGVEEVLVAGEPHALTGNIVRAVINLSTDETAEQFRKRMWEFCRTRLEYFKIPQKVIIEKGELHSGRFKKMRAQKSEPSIER